VRSQSGENFRKANTSRSAGRRASEPDEGARLPKIEPIQTIVFAFRKNGHYENIRPFLEEFCAREGRVLLPIEIPEHTPKKDIKEWLSPHNLSVRNSFLIADYTVLDNRPIQFKGELSRCVINNVLDAATMRFLENESSKNWGRNYTQAQMNSPGLTPRAYAKQYTERLEKLFSLAVQTRAPERVYIFKPELHEHDPFKIKPVPRNPAEHVKKWLMKAGVEPEDIAIVENYEGLKDVSLDNIENCWFVGDRHYLWRSALSDLFCERLKKEDEVLPDDEWLDEDEHGNDPGEEEDIASAEAFVEVREKGSYEGRSEDDEEGDFDVNVEIAKTRKLFVDERISKAVVLRLPLEDFVPNLIEQGLISVDQFADTTDCYKIAAEIILDRLNTVERQGFRR